MSGQTESRNTNGTTLSERLEDWEKHERSEGAADKAELLKWAREEIEELRMAALARPISEYRKDMGDVLWWRLPIVEPPYFGSPLCEGFTVVASYRKNGEEEAVHHDQVGGWHSYHTHFTQILKVRAPIKKDIGRVG